MGKSKGHKYWNRFSAWTRTEGQVRVEVPDALEEFFGDPSRIPADARRQVEMLFDGWFCLDRKLTRARMTPLELYMRSMRRELSAAELAIYERFAKENRFGLFKVEETRPGESFDLRPMSGGPLLRVLDVAGSESARKGAYLVTRLLPFEDHWTMPNFVGSYPAEAGYDFDRLFGEGGREAGELRPRDVLRLYIPKIDWTREGLPRVKARFAMVLQRWCVADITAATVEKEIRAAHERRDMLHPLLKPILERAPSEAEAKEAMELLTAWWNLTLPEPEEKVFPRGPKEMMLLRDLQRAIGDQVTDLALEDSQKAAELTRELTRKWMDAPQKELGGKTPAQVIRQERESLANPREELGISIVPTRMELPAQEQESVRLANEGTDFLIKKDAARALELLEKAYAGMKGRRDACRVLGKMATACMMLGRRERALELLRAALQADPDYDVARNNLQLLESMSAAEFKRKHKAGFFQNVNVVAKGRG